MIRVDSQPLYDALCPEWKLAPVPEPEERLSIVPLSSPVVAPGEPVTFGVSLLRHGKPVSGIGLKCKMEREFHEPVEFPLPTRSYPVEVTTDLERPGFVRLEARYGELSAAGGGAVAPFEIAGLPDVPGFDEFWQRQLALLRSVPMKVLKMEEIAPVLPEYADRVRCFDLRIACAGAKPVSAILAMPRNAAPRSCPGYAFFHGAGVRSAFQPLTWAAHGLIALNVVLILAYLYFIHYPISHSAYASGDPGQLDAQYEGARVVDQRLGVDYSYYVLRTADGGSTFLAIEHARFFKRYRIGYAQVLPDDRPCTVEFALDGTYRSATVGSADVIETAGINGSAPGVTLTVNRIQFWGAFLVIAMVIVELVAYHLLKKLLHKRTSP